MVKGYSADIKPENTARARGYELDISPKKSYEVCNAIRGMKVETAEKYLENVQKMKTAVPMRRYNQETAHKRGHMGPGRFPIKVAAAILRVLQHAKANAEFKGLEPDDMRIVHVSANRGRITQARMQRAHGRSTEWNEQTTTIEVIIEQKKVE